VLEQNHLLAVLRDHHLDEVLAGARKAASAAVASEGAAGEIVDVDVVQALSAPEGLRDTASRLQADAILLGRAAPREGQGLVRLGRVARRLLRITTLPVVVVPPDMRQADFAGDGPVIALTKLVDDSVPICRFADAVARQLGRPLVIAHVVEPANVSAAQYVAAATLDRVSGERRADAEAALTKWVAALGIRPDATEVLAGNVVEEVTALARDRRAALIVAGSRHGGSTLERLLVASTGSELAAAATRPVAIVPPPHT
jgi:nucleotide-binding universal stress UspA family protein